MATASIGAPGLRPLSVGEILDAAIKICLRHARTLVVLAAVVVLPFQVLSAFVTLSTVQTSSEVPGGFAGLHAADRTASLGGQAIVALIGVVVGLLTTAACVKAVSDAYLDHAPGVGGSLGFAARRIGALIVLEILLVTGLVLAFLCFIVPAIWLYAAWAVATPALLIEGVGPAGALARSHRLVRGRWWQTAGLLLVTNIMIWVIGGALVAALLAITLSGATRSVTSTVFLTSLASAASSVLTRPFQAAVTTVLYYDLRVRHEGYDVQLLAEQLGVLPGDTQRDRAPVTGSAPVVGSPPPAGPPTVWGPESVGTPGGPPYWPPPPGWGPPPPDSSGIP